MRVTKQFLMQNRTEKGGWTKKQLNALGLNWPPVKNWHQSVIGKELSDSDVEKFKLQIAKKDLNQM